MRCIRICDAPVDVGQVHVPASGEGGEVVGSSSVSPRHGGNFSIPVGMQAGDPVPLGALTQGTMRYIERR